MEALLSMLILAFAVALGIFRSTQALRVVNENVIRTIFLTGEVVREEHVISAKFSDVPHQFAADVPQELASEVHDNWFPNYIALVPPSAAKNLAGFDAAQIDAAGVTNPIKIADITLEMQNCERFGYRCLSIEFPPSESIEKTVKFAISYAFINQVSSQPSMRKAMSDPLQLSFKSEYIDAVSPYTTLDTKTILAITQGSKSIRFKCPVGRKPERLDTTLPFNMKGFACTGTTQGSVEFQFETKDVQMLRIKSLIRRLTFMPWDNTIQVSESYDIVHEGFQIPDSPKFDRIEFLKILYKNKGNLQGTQIVPKVMLVVPNSARGLQIRDEVGINWAPIQRSKVSPEEDAVNVPFRFPLVGGMSSAFDFHYTVPASVFIGPFQSQSSPFKKLFQMHVAHLAMDSPIENLKVIISLPEDSGDIEYELGTTKTSHVSRRRYRSYFSTIGENEITFEFENITRDETEKLVAVLFNYPWWGVFRKPLVVLASIVSLIASVVYLVKCSFRLEQATPQQNQMRVQLKKLFNKRRELLLDLEDLIAVNCNAKANAEQQQADMDNRARLEEQIRAIESSIFERIKVNAKDPQMNTLNGIALKRLYDDQIGVVNKIMADVFSQRSGNSASVDSIGNFSSRCSMSSVHLSKSNSGDLLKRPQISEKLAGLSAEAFNIDSQISIYEAKFL